MWVCERARKGWTTPQQESSGEECRQVFCFLFTEEGGGWLPVGFENIWSTTEGYMDKIQLWWNGYNFTSLPSFVLARKLKALMKGMRKWNKWKYGDVGLTKEELLIELQLLDGKEGGDGLSQDEQITREELTTAGLEAAKQW